MSTDKTYDILKTYGKKIRLERVKGSVPKVHNHVLRNVDTEFVAYTDADCVVEKDWLEKLMSGFTSEDIVATAGYCGTPKGVSRLQRLIGLELEDRFKHFPEFISRAPTMNMCVRTKVARKVGWDERFSTAVFETDFGWRLTKRGKMKYIPEARVYHYHRADWKRFFKQQFNYGRHLPMLYLKHKEKIVGDHISKPSMMFQEFVFLFGVFFLVLSIFNKLFFHFSITCFSCLSFLYLFDILRLTRKTSEIILLFILYFWRTIAWSVGLFFGVIRLIKWWVT